MENKGQKFKNICEKMLSTYEKKNHDYGDSFSESIGRFGYVAAATRMYDKLERFINLAVDMKYPKVDESVKDTLLDLANYAIMTLLYIDEVDKELQTQTTISFT